MKRDCEHEDYDNCKDEAQYCDNCGKYLGCFCNENKIQCFDCSMEEMEDMKHE